MEIVDNKALVLRTRNPHRYAMIPKSKVLGTDTEGISRVIVHWGLDEARVLKNMGVRDVPSPILRSYEWPGRFTPFKHQIETSAFLTMHKRAFVFSEPGTGKTLSALWAADYLMRMKIVHRCLVLCPLSIMQSAWMADLNSSIIHRSAVVCHHSKSERRRAMIGKNYEFVIANYDGLPLIADTLQADGRFDLIIADEANAYKNVSTRRWKTLASLMAPNVHLWMMTGTPAAQSPEDAYGLARLVSPERVPRFFTGWRDKVMYKATMFKWLPKGNAYAQVHEALQPAIRFTKKECLDLPPVLTETRDVPLTAQQQKYYKMMRDKLVMHAAGETVTAINAAAEVNKLLQISAGAAYTDNKEVVEFDCSSRLKVLGEVLDETERKVLIFTLFRHSMDSIEHWLTKNNISCAQINGSITPTKRTQLFRAFQTTDTPRVLIIQPQAAQHGVTLTAADTVVMWGPVMSVESYIQCVARMDRQGQTSDNVTVVHIQGSDIERRMFNRLSGKVEDHSLLLKIYEEEVAAARLER